MEKEKDSSNSEEGSNYESSSEESIQSQNVAHNYKPNTIPERETQKLKKTIVDNLQDVETDYDWNKKGSLSLIKDSYVSPDTSSNQLDSSIDISDSISHKVECLLNDDNTFPKTESDPSSKRQFDLDVTEVASYKDSTNDISLRLAKEQSCGRESSEVEEENLSLTEIDVFPDSKHNFESCDSIDSHHTLDSSKKHDLPSPEVVAVTKPISGGFELSDVVTFSKPVSHTEITLPVNISQSRMSIQSVLTSEYSPVSTEIHSDIRNASEIENIASDARISDHQALHDKYKEIYFDDKNKNEVALPQEAKELSLLNLNEYEQTDHRTSPLSISSTASSKRLEWDNGFDIGYDASKLYPFMFKAVISKSTLPTINSENSNSDQNTNNSNTHTVTHLSSSQVQIIPASVSDDEFHKNIGECSRFLSTTGKNAFDVNVQVAETGCSTEELKSDFSSEESQTDFGRQSQSDGSVTNYDSNPELLDENHTFTKGLKSDEETYEHDETCDNVSKEKTDDMSSNVPANVASDYTLSGKNIFFSKSIPGVPFQCLESHILPSKTCVVNNSTVSSEILQQVRAFFEVPSTEYSQTEASDQTPHIRWYPLMSDHHMQDIKNVSTQTAASFLSEKSEFSDVPAGEKFRNAGSQFNNGENSHSTTPEFGSSHSLSARDNGNPPFERMEGVGKCQTPPISVQISSPSDSPLPSQHSEKETSPKSNVDDEQEAFDDSIPIEVNAKPETYVLSSVHLCKEHGEYLKKLANLSLLHTSEAQTISSRDSHVINPDSKEITDEADSFSNFDEHIIVDDHSKKHFIPRDDIDKRFDDKLFHKRYVDDANLRHSTASETNQAMVSCEDTQMIDLHSSSNDFPAHSTTIASEDDQGLVDIELIDKESFTSSESLENFTQSLMNKSLKSDDDTGTSSNENVKIQSSEINNLIDWVRKKNKKFKNVLNYIKAEQNMLNYHSKKARRLSSASSNPSLNMKNKINTILIDTVENTKLLNYFLGNCKKSDFNSRLCALRIEVVLNELYEAYESALDILKHDNMHQLVLAHSKKMQDHSLDHSVCSTPVFHSESTCDNIRKVKSDTRSLPDYNVLQQGLTAKSKSKGRMKTFKGNTNKNDLYFANDSTISESKSQNLNNDSILKLITEHSLSLSCSHGSDILHTDSFNNNDTKLDNFHSAQTSSSSGLFDKIEPSSIDSRLQVLSGLEHIGWIMDKSKKHKIILNYVKKKIHHFKKKHSRASTQDKSITNALQSIKYKLYTVLMDSIDNTRLLNYFILISNKAEFHSRLCSLKACMALKEVYEVYECAFNVWSGDDLSSLIGVGKSSSSVFVSSDEKRILHPSKIKQKIDLILNQSKSSLDLETNFIDSKKGSETWSEILNHSSDNSDKTQSLICDFEDLTEKNPKLSSSSTLSQNKQKLSSVARGTQSSKDIQPLSESISSHQAQSKDDSKLKSSKSNYSANSNSSFLFSDISVGKSSSSHKQNFSIDTSSSLLTSAQSFRKSSINSDLHRSYSAPAASLRKAKETYSQTSPVVVSEEVVGKTASAPIDNSQKSNSLISSHDQVTEATPSLSKDHSKKTEVSSLFSDHTKSSLFPEQNLNSNLSLASSSRMISVSNSSAVSHDSTSSTNLLATKPNLKSSKSSHRHITSSSSFPLTSKKQLSHYLAKESAVLHADKATSVSDSLCKSSVKENDIESSTNAYKKGKIVRSVRGENLVVIFEKINAKRTSLISSSSSNEDRVFVSKPLSLQEAFNKERPGFAEESLARASRFDRQFDMNKRMTYWKVVMAQNGTNATTQKNKDTSDEKSYKQNYIASTKPMIERVYGSTKRWPDTLSKKKREAEKKKRLQSEGRIMTKLFSERLKARALNGEVDIGLHDRLVVD